MYVQLNVWQSTKYMHGNCYLLKSLRFSSASQIYTASLTIDLTFLYSGLAYCLQFKFLPSTCYGTLKEQQQTNELIPC